MKRLALKLVLLLICMGMLTACSGETQAVWKEEMLPELPEGFSIAQQDSKMVIMNGDAVVGGLDCYLKPDVQPDFYYRWIHDLPLWENQDETLGYSGGGSIYGDWELEYFSDVPPGDEITVNRQHTFYVTEEFVYDIWFDGLLISEEIMREILQTIVIER